MTTTDRPYGKFIILSSPRSGTHMIRTVLRNHPNLVAHSELFNPDFLKDKPFGPETPAEVILEEHIYRTYPPQINKVGFIIHRSGTPFGDWPDLWTRLVADKSIFVISLRRKNLLRRYLSYQVMRTFRGATPQPLHFDPQVLEADFIRQEKEIAEFDRRFTDHPLIKVYYEDLCKDYEASVERVLDFLEVSRQQLWPDIKGKPIRKLSEAIVNYDELSAHFFNSKWAHFFNDEEQVIHISRPKPQAIRREETSNWKDRIINLFKIKRKDGV